MCLPKVNLYRLANGHPDEEEDELSVGDTRVVIEEGELICGMLHKLTLTLTLTLTPTLTLTLTPTLPLTLTPTLPLTRHARQEVARHLGRLAHPRRVE